MASSSRTPKKIRNIRRFLILSVILIVIIPLLSVVISWEHIYHKKQALKTPYDYAGSTWISTEPEMVLHVSNSSRIPDDSECYIINQGEHIPVIFYPGYPTVSCVVLRDDPKVEILVGSCKFSEKEVIFKISTDSFFAGQYREITLRRTG